MESHKNSFNLNDLVNLGKNLAIFFIPMAITLLTALQNGTDITASFIYGMLISTLIKILEYYGRGLPTETKLMFADREWIVIVLSILFIVFMCFPVGLKPRYFYLLAKSLMEEEVVLEETTEEVVAEEAVAE